MTALLDAFGFPPLPGAPLTESLALADSYSDRWDYRQGRERIATTGETFPADLDALIRTTTTALGLADRRKPQDTSYDHLLVLGGGVRTMMARSTFAADIVRSGVHTSTVAGLGSLRVLDHQGGAARKLGLRSCPTEGDAVHETLRATFRPAGPVEPRSGPDWWVRSYLDATPQMHVLAVPSTRPGIRANTADGYTGWADLVTQPAAGARLLLVTTDLFVPFQHLDAVRTLGLRFGCTIDTIGFATAANPYVAPSRTFELLQELRAAIRALRRLHDALLHPR
ncbi:hypothetical protein ACFO1B_40225 [Dactylosporangium siamense]|nr:hypothetical protein [Dactylosporangium siamense]